MFTEPTIDDFVARIEDHTQRSLDIARYAVREIEHKSNARGSYRGGSTVAQIFREVLAEFERGLDGALEKFRNSSMVGKLDTLEMREILGDHLDVYRNQMKDVTKHEKLRGFSSTFGRRIDEELEKFNQILALKLRQFDVGYHDMGEKHMRDMVIVHGSGNNIITGDGNIAQQGTTNSKQTVNSADILHKLNALQEALSAAQLPASHHTEIKGDIDTIKAQLTKPTPSTSIVREAAQSIMRVVEAALGGALSHPLAAAAGALLEIIGLA